MPPYVAQVPPAMHQHAYDANPVDPVRHFVLPPWSVPGLARTLLDARPLVRVKIGSHNLRSVAHAIAYNRLTGGGDSDLELQVLRGLGDELAEALRVLRLRVRAYCPVGDLVAGLAYLVRRLLENTSTDSFLADRAAGSDLDRLLRAP